MAMLSPTGPLLSVIIPAFENPADLDSCLRSLRQSEFQDFEVVVADDGSSDVAAIAGVAAKYDAHLVRLEKNSGPGAARNAAAGVARAPVLVFVDADVTVHRDTLSLFHAAFNDPSLDAVFGAYDEAPEVTGRIAVFRNLLHAHVHRRSWGAATTFWAGCGAVRRTRFEELGGFDESFDQPSIEDVEFGARLSEAGGRILLDPSIQVTHHKGWTLASVVHADLFCRALPWTRLMMSHGLPRNLNFRTVDRLAIAAAVALPLSAVLPMEHGVRWIWAPIAAILAIGLLQLPLFRFLARTRGIGFAALSLPLYVLHLWCGAAGFALGLADAERRRDRWFPWAAALAAVLVIGVLQIGGGAYRAEYDGFPDEAAHMETGLMIRDFVVRAPAVNPIAWAEEYYLHYPKVALGHWPPLFHIMEAAWWLWTPPSRTSAILLIGLLGVASALAFYRLARRLAHPALAIAAMCILIASPVFQESANRVMAEMPTLLFSILFVTALARFLEDGFGGAAIQSSVWLAAVLLVKGTGVYLIPVPLIAIAATGKWNLVRRLWTLGTMAPIALSGALCAGWYGLQALLIGRTDGWAGFGRHLPWRVDDLLALAGPGLLALAIAGLIWTTRRGNALAAVAGSLLVSAVATSFAMRAMREPRHWILVLPAVLILSLLLVERILRIRPAVPRMAAGILAAAAALVFFPSTWYRQMPAGYEALSKRLPRSGRFLVSGNHSWEEGSWIVTVSLRETRPTSFVVRASKLLASSGWNGNQYRLLADTAGQVKSRLDDLGIETVVLDNHIAGDSVPHHQLLAATIGADPGWRQCAQVQALVAYCRTQAVPLTGHAPAWPNLRPFGMSRTWLP